MSAPTTGCRWISTSAASSTPSCTCCTRASGRKVMRDLGLVKFGEPFTNLLTQGMVLNHIYSAPARRRAQALLQSRPTSTRAAAPTAATCTRSPPPSRHAAGRARRPRQDVEVQEQRRRPGGLDRALRRRHRAPVHDVRRRRPSRRSSGRMRACRARSASSAACGRRCTSTSRARRRRRALDARGARRGAAARAAARRAPDAGEGDRRHRPAPQLQHRGRRGHGAAERGRDASSDASPQGRAVRQEALEIAVLVLVADHPARHATRCGRSSGTQTRADRRALAGGRCRQRCVQDALEIVVQVNGKLRGRVSVPADADEADGARGRARRRARAEVRRAASRCGKRDRRAGQARQRRRLMRAPRHVSAGLRRSLALLAGCGFHLQGRAPLPASVKTPYVEAPDRQTDFVQSLRRALLVHGAQLAQRARQGHRGGQHPARTTSRGACCPCRRATSPTEYEVTYTVRVLGRPPATRSCWRRRKCRRTRTYSFDEPLLLAKEHEEDILREAMAQRPGRHA